MELNKEYILENEDSFSLLPTLYGFTFQTSSTCTSTSNSGKRLYSEISNNNGKEEDVPPSKLAKLKNNKEEVPQYISQIKQIKEILGNEKSDSELIEALKLSKGNIEAAMDHLLNPNPNSVSPSTSSPILSRSFSPQLRGKVFLIQIFLFKNPKNKIFTFKKDFS